MRQRIATITARYPWLMAVADRHYHLFYTHAVAPGSEIVHVRFSRDWLAANGYKTVLHLRAPGEDDVTDRRQFEARGQSRALGTGEGQLLKS